MQVFNFLKNWLAWRKKNNLQTLLEMWVTWWPRLSPWIPKSWMTDICLYQVSILPPECLIYFPISYRNQGIDVYGLWSMYTIILIFIDLYAVKFPDSFYWSLLDIGHNVGLMFFLVWQGCNTQFYMSHSLRL